MPAHHCCYGVCKSDSRYRDRVDMENVYFIPFPKPKSQLEKCQRWILACGRKDFGTINVTRHTYMCSKHFVGGRGPTSEHPDPVAFHDSRSCRPPPKARKSNHEFVDQPTAKKQRTEENIESKEDASGVETVGPMTALSDHPYYHQPKTYNEVKTQTNLKFSDFNLSDDILTSTKLLQRELTIKTITSDDKSSRFYTGLNLALLMLVFNWLKQKAERMSYWRGATETRTEGNSSSRGPSRGLTLYQEYLITLFRLRRGNDIEQISDMFGVSVSHISRIFNSWISLMCRELSFLIKWPSSDIVRQNLPKCFKYFPKTIAVIDCTEFFLQKPSIPSSQRITWSSYKHSNTLKCLVACSPKGTFTFVSDLWSGSISDRKVVQSSGFLDLVCEGDDVMADKGFLIRDLLATRKATLNIPPFCYGKQLSSHAVTKTRRIATARIHVERAIGRLKEFKLLQGVIPLKMKGSLNQSVFVAAALCNLDSVLVK